MTDAIVFGIILAASFLFAMLGLGGGMVYVPLIKWAGYDLKTVAIPLGLLLNGLNTLLALIPFARARLVDWGGALPMGIAATLAAPLGAWMMPQVPTQQLLLLFAGAVIAAAWRMAITASRDEPMVMMALHQRWLLGGVAGAAIGFLGGLLGIGGGFVIAPLLMAMGYPTKMAAATTAYVVTFSSFSGFLGHAAEGRIPWQLAVIGAAAVLLGSQFGAYYLTEKARTPQVKRIYAAVLVVIAIKLLFDATRGG
ncbi:MAG: sulfite exporter TauE/SafE family protein [Sulfuritalea sp.]|jgi:hypothetical protein|nr:sulfite exporter TauE/SafE family protein [Sulfuritalea sp.]